MAEVVGAQLAERGAAGDRSVRIALRQAASLDAIAGGRRSFEIRCKGVLVMDVENAPSRVLIRMPADAMWRAPDIERLRISFERWLDLHQSQGQLLVESAGPSWLEARFGRFGVAVPDRQRCLFEGPGRSWQASPGRFVHPADYCRQSTESQHHLLQCSELSRDSRKSGIAAPFRWNLWLH